MTVTHAMQQGQGPQFRAPNKWATECGRESENIGSGRWGKLPPIPVTCRRCITIRTRRAQEELEKGLGWR